MTEYWVKKERSVDGKQTETLRRPSSCLSWSWELVQPRQLRRFIARE